MKTVIDTLWRGSRDSRAVKCRLQKSKGFHQSLTAAHGTLVAGMSLGVNRYRHVFFFDPGPMRVECTEPLTIGAWKLSAGEILEVREVLPGGDYSVLRPHAAAQVVPSTVCREIICARVQSFMVGGVSRTGAPRAAPTTPPLPPSRRGRLPCACVCICRAAGPVQAGKLAWNGLAERLLHLRARGLCRHRAPANLSGTPCVRRRRGQANRQGDY